MDWKGGEVAISINPDFTSLFRASDCPVSTTTTVSISISMSYRRSVIRLLKCGAVGGVLATGVSLYLPESNRHFRKVSERFSVAAKSKDVDASQSDVINNMYQDIGTKWNNNWDCRY